MKDLLKKVMNGQDLTEEESATMLDKMANTDNYAQAGALLSSQLKSHVLEIPY